MADVESGDGDVLAQESAHILVAASTSAAPRLDGAPRELGARLGEDRLEQRLAARAIVEGRAMVSEVRHEGEVVQVARTFAWIMPLAPLDVLDAVLERLRDMNEAVRKKALRKTGRLFYHGSTENVVYLGGLDMDGSKRLPRVGSKVSFKLYVDNHGVGGYEVIVSEDAATSGSPSPPTEGNIPATGEGQQEDTCTRGHPKSSSPRKRREWRIGWNTRQGYGKESLPRYTERFPDKVADEERMVLDIWCEGEVVKRSRLFAWVKPLDASLIPDSVQPLLKEMND